MVQLVKVDKKEIIIDNAVAVFAEKGYYKATTAMVAKAAAVTQPYVFHFFKNKEELFKAVLDRAFYRIHDRFMEIEAPAEQLVEAMGHEFFEVINQHRDEVLMVMQAYTIPEPFIRNHVSELYQLIYDSLVRKFDAVGIKHPEMHASQFIGTGLLITLSEVLNMPNLIQHMKGC
mgnify:CR=1 FL=1